MGDVIGSGLLSMAVCFDFRSTNVVQLSTLISLIDVEVGINVEGGIFWKKLVN